MWISEEIITRAKSPIRKAQVSPNRQTHAERVGCSSSEVTGVVVSGKCNGWRLIDERIEVERSGRALPVSDDRCRETLRCRNQRR